MNVQGYEIPIKDRLAALKNIFLHETAQLQSKEDIFLQVKPHAEEKAPLVLGDKSDCDLNEGEFSIIESYPGNLHYLLKALVKMSKLTPATSSYTQWELDNFKHNMRHLFVDAVNYDGGWHSADLRTLWADGWREQDVIRFMMAKKVKYIMCNNAKLISCLNLQADGVVYFER